MILKSKTISAFLLRNDHQDIQGERAQVAAMYSIFTCQLKS